jgi:hypothetical protein
MDKGDFRCPVCRNEDLQYEADCPACREDPWETVWTFIKIWSMVFALMAGLPREIPV